MTAAARQHLGNVVALDRLIPTDDECAALEAPAPRARTPEWSAWFKRYVEAGEIRRLRYSHFSISGWNYPGERVHVVSNIHRFLFQLAGPLGELKVAAMHEAEAFRAFLVAEVARLEAEAERHDERSIRVAIRSIIAGALRRLVALFLAAARSAASIDPANIPRILAAGGQSAHYAPLN